MKIILDKTYLNFPVKNGALKKVLRLEIGGRPVREFEIELADSEPDFWVFLDISTFKDSEAKIHSDSEIDERVRNLIHQSDEFEGSENLYQEPLRPQFHFSSRRGWNNDPNGMVYYDGEYHLYYQHNPYGWRWGNMHWGHAISSDLVHWKELPIALYPHKFGDWAFSGSAVVDTANTGGFKTGDEDVIVAAYTSTGRIGSDTPLRGECIVYSNDRGRTFTEYEGNPVVTHQGRDPKIIWYEPGQHWVMAVYDEEGQGDEVRRFIAFYTSMDLRNWEFQSKIEGYYECAELFELPVDGKTEQTRWVLFAADAKYAVGNFDGKAFTPDHDGKHQVHYGSYYASQTFDNAPDIRRIQIGWGRIEMEGMPFNQMMTFPTELSLKTTEDGIRMFARPVDEIENLWGAQHSLEMCTISPGQPKEIQISNPLLDIRAEMEGDHGSVFGLDIGDHRITYDTRKQILQDMPLAPDDGRIALQILVDRSSIEICGNKGRVFHTSAFRCENLNSIRFWSEGGDARLLNATVNELDSIWS